MSTGYEYITRPMRQAAGVKVEPEPATLSQRVTGAILAAVFIAAFDAIDAMILMFALGELHRQILQVPPLGYWCAYLLVLAWRVLVVRAFKKAHA